MKDFTECLMFKTQYNPELNETFVVLSDCLKALEQAYNDGLNDANKVKKENNKPLWKDDYNAYISIVEDSKETLLSDI